jgi:formate-dependent nitrite reductase membrane component NrfD
VPIVAGWLPGEKLHAFAHAARGALWLGRAVPVLHKLSDAIVGRPQWIAALGWANLVLGIGLGIYTGILLNTMVARPLWNSAVLGPLFLASGLSSAAALVHGVTRDRAESELLARADNRFLQAEIVLLALFGGQSALGQLVLLFVALGAAVYDFLVAIGALPFASPTMLNPVTRDRAS